MPKLAKAAFKISPVADKDSQSRIGRLVDRPEVGTKFLHFLLATRYEYIFELVNDEKQPFFGQKIEALQEQRQEGTVVRLAAFKKGGLQLMGNIRGREAQRPYVDRTSPRVDGARYQTGVDKRCLAYA